MRTHTNRLILAASIAVSGLCFNGFARADDGTQTTGQNAVDRAKDSTQNAADNAGTAIRRSADKLMTGSTTQPSDDTAMAPDAKDIRTTLAEVTQAAVTKGGFDDLVERFIDTDRARFNKDTYTKEDHAILDSKIAQFQKDWKDRYNQDFKIPDKNVVYDDSFAMIMQRQNSDNARLAADRQTADHSQTATVDDKSSQPGRSIATVTIAASHGMPELPIMLVHEFPDRWKIDVPDNYSAMQLHNSLLNQLTMLDEHKDQWPDDVNDAYRAVTHHILMAVINTTGQHEKTSDMNH